MKLLAVVVIGFVALAGSKAHNPHHHRTHSHVGNNAQETENYGQYSSDFGLNRNQEQNSQEFTSQRYNDQNESDERTMYNQYAQGQNDQFSESNWEVQSTQQLNNKNSQNLQARENNQEYYGINNQRRPIDSYSQQNSQEQYQQNIKNKHESVSYFNSGSSSSQESNSQEDNVKEQNNGDIAYEIGHNVAIKMVKFFNIVEKYAAHNGTVQTNQAQEPLALRQWALPMEHHQFLSMNGTKVNGLSQGIINAMYINTENNCVNLEYYFKNLLVKGYMKASLGSKGLFDMQMTNSNVNVSTVLENRNRNYAHSINGKIELSNQNSQDSSETNLTNENIKSKYVQFINRAIESELIDNSYNGLVGCLRSEMLSTFDMPFTRPQSDLVIENKKSQVTVALKNSQTWTEEYSNKQRTVHSFAFRQNQSGNGYKMKVKVILAKQPTWNSDVIAKDAHQQINIKNVHFSAKKIVASAIMERVELQNGAYKFNVENTNIKIDGFKYNIEKFNQEREINQKLSLEIGQNLQTIIENGMSGALKQQLYQQQQICQQNQENCVRCNQYNFQ